MLANRAREDNFISSLPSEPVTCTFPSLSEVCLLRGAFYFLFCTHQTDDGITCDNVCEGHTVQPSCAVVDVFISTRRRLAQRDPPFPQTCLNQQQS